ncbi:hypothetical protein M8C13_08980 [Crossiella sp. SN42]|uniref:hypothetical protein n=1 Tax=Crossiella sp. SN42 TaxID=2944808 RepID=UPI00207D66DD|nr:hypothetical protein [Crossiella sp. SN42]MCO1575890.1 hypothetical protein [Crossiella sp. SN42]
MRALINHRNELYRSPSQHPDHSLDGSDSAVFFLGRGRTATALSRRQGAITPAELVTQPYGRELLASTTDAAYRSLVKKLRTPVTEPIQPLGADGDPLRCPPGGHRAVKWRHYTDFPVPTCLYAFEYGQVFLWLVSPTHDPDDDEIQLEPHGQWASLLLPQKGSADPVWLIPEARDYGEKIQSTVDLDMKGVASLIMADFRREREKNAALSLCQDLWIDLAEDLSVTLYVFGLADADLNLPPYRKGGPFGSRENWASPGHNELQDDIEEALTNLTRPYDWTNPIDPDNDTRLGLSIRILTEDGQRRHTTRRGTVTGPARHR